MMHFTKIKKIVAATMAFVAIGFGSLNVTSCSGSDSDSIIKLLTGLSEDKEVSGRLSGRDLRIFLEANSGNFSAYEKEEAMGSYGIADRALQKPDGEPFCKGTFANANSELYLVVTAKQDAFGKCTAVAVEDYEYLKAPVDLNAAKPSFSETDVKVINKEDFEKVATDYKPLIELTKDEATLLKNYARVQNTNDIVYVMTFEKESLEKTKVLVKARTDLGSDSNVSDLDFTVEVKSEDEMVIVEDNTTDKFPTTLLNHWEALFKLIDKGVISETVIANYPAIATFFATVAFNYIPGEGVDYVVYKGTLEEGKGKANLEDDGTEYSSITEIWNDYDPTNYKFFTLKEDEAGDLVAEAQFDINKDYEGKVQIIAVAVEQSNEYVVYPGTIEEGVGKATVTGDGATYIFASDVTKDFGSDKYKLFVLTVNEKNELVVEAQFEPSKSYEGKVQILAVLIEQTGGTTGDIEYVVYTGTASEGIGEVTITSDGASYTSVPDILSAFDSEEYKLFVIIENTDGKLVVDAEFDITKSYEGKVQILAVEIEQSGSNPSMS